MGVVQLVGFVGCWVLVVALVLWGFITERRRRPRPSATSSGLAAADWFVVEEAEGDSSQVADRAHFLAKAWLATRGLDLAHVPPGGIRTEVTTTGDGISTTRVLLRSVALQTSLRPR
jgi:hypothetical protein